VESTIPEILALAKGIGCRLYDEFNVYITDEDLDMVIWSFEFRKEVREQWAEMTERTLTEIHDMEHKQYYMQRTK